MKFILCLALLLAVSSAAFLRQQSSSGPFTPQWKVTNTFDNAWTPTYVYSLGNPGASGYNQVSVCGTANAELLPKQWRFQLTDGTTTTQEWTYGVTYETLFQDSQFCFSISYQVEANYTTQYSLLLTLESFDARLVSLQVDFTL